MALRRSVVVVALCAAVLGTACGFSETGAIDVSADGGVGGPEGPGRGSASGADGSVPGAEGSSPGTDGSAPMGVPVCNPPSCALPAPTAGWEVVLYGTSRADACPAGFDSADLLESPAAGPNACTCAACVKTGTTCSTGSITTKADSGGGACGSGGSTLDANGGNCQNLNTQFGTDALVLAPNAVRGTCTSAATGVPANVTSQPRRVCTRQASTCAGSACGAPPTMTACLAAPGDVACPSGTKHVLGSGVTLACPSCGCTITSATCGGTMDFFGQSNCSGTATTLTAGVCKFTNGAGVQSAKWKGVVASEVCSTTPGAPTLTLATAQTVCCP